MNLGAAYVVVKAKNEMAKGLKAARKSVGSAVTAMAKMAIIPITIGTAALIAGITKSITKFGEYETVLVDMGKVTSESFESITAKIRTLPAELGTATALTKGYYQVISAGVTEPVAAMELLVTSAKMAKTAHVEQGSAVEGLTSIMAAFGVSSIVAGESMQQMEKLGKTSVGRLVSIIGEISSTSALVGLSLDEMGAAFGRVTLQSGGTEKAATQYKALMMSLISPTTAMAALLKDYGGAQEAIKAIGFEGVLRLITNAAEGNATTLRKIVGPAEAVLAINALVSDGMQGLSENMIAMSDKTGKLDKAWKDYRGTLAAIWETFKNVVGNQLIWIGDKLAPAIKAVIEALGVWLEVNRDLFTNEIADWWEKVVDFAKGLKPLISEIVTKFGEWYDKSEQFLKSGFKNTLTAIKDVILEIPGFISRVITASAEMQQSIGNAVSAIVSSIKYAVKTIQIAVSAIVSSIENAIKTIQKSAFFSSIENAIKTIQKQAILVIGNIRTDIWRAKQDMLNFLDLFTPTSTIEYIIKLFGEGSTKKPITEKIDEVAQKMGNLSKFIETMKPSFTIDATPATATIENIKASLQSLTSYGIGFKGVPLDSPAPQRYKTPAEEIAFLNASSSTAARITNVSVSVNPTFMTGDKNAAKNAADIIWNEIRDKVNRLN